MRSKHFWTKVTLSRLLGNKLISPKGVFNWKYGQAKLLIPYNFAKGTYLEWLKIKLDFWLYHCYSLCSSETHFYSSTWSRWMCERGRLVNKWSITRLWLRRHKSLSSLALLTAQRTPVNYWNRSLEKYFPNQIRALYKRSNDCVGFKGWPGLTYTGYRILKS